MSPLITTKASASAQGYGLFSPALVTGNFQSIQTVTLTTSATTVSLSSIPSTFTHLQIRGLLKLAESGTSDNWATFTANGISTNAHQLQGSGSSVAGSNLNPWLFDAPQSGVTPYLAFILNIIDYSNTNKNKTWRSLNGFDNNGSGYVNFTSGFSVDLTAISSVTFGSRSGSGLAAGSTFALYGVK